MNSETQQIYGILTWQRKIHEHFTGTKPLVISTETFPRINTLRHRDAQLNFTPIAAAIRNHHSLQTSVSALSKQLEEGQICLSRCKKVEHFKRALKPTTKFSPRSQQRAATAIHNLSKGIHLGKFRWPQGFCSSSPLR